jgi:ThiF family
VTTRPAKVRVACDHLRQVNPWTDVAVWAGDVTHLTPAHFAGADLVIGAVDNDGARVALARLAMAAGVDLIDAGVRADIFTGRVTVTSTRVGGPCLACSWSRDRLARSGEDVGLPCAGLETVPIYGSTLLMAQATAALAVHQALAMTGVTGEPAWLGHELRVDLHAGRFERFRRSLDPACAADHVLAAPDASPLPVAPEAISLGALMAACGASADTIVVLAGRELVPSALCPNCSTRVRPFLPPAHALHPCAACGVPVAAARRTRRVRWGDAATTVGGLSASTWFQPGDVFAVVDDSRPRKFAFAPPLPLAWEAGQSWDAAANAIRFARLPRCYDLERVRAVRLALVGLGHLGAAILQALAPLPWAALLCCDRDFLEPLNAQSYPLPAAAEVTA